MSSRLWMGVPVAVLAVAPVFAVVGTAPAQAAPSGPGVAVNFTCTGQTYAGEDLPEVTVSARAGVRAAKGQAQTSWRGVARFSSIECKPV
ncbi:hypothetical protein GFY24_20100 [Nocardia sp. SYP-A9097]|uniref:hypothetical protein n=1 Tax=Nocardia sp. SYP-A9097 TaxID=2663237 RepID=UPI00129A85D7|nr:hypothetical protein [Nocardia sp. SYP-A9097]MRH89719.1 hypothetical protein [Nocardia sp. SYP-A9097]